MDWAEDYIEQCLLYIPKSKYRNRLQSELADHLTQLAADLEGVGYAPEEARAEALRQMGEAATLNERYCGEWLRRPERVRYDLLRLLSGFLLAGLFSFCGNALFVGISVGISMLRHGTSIYSSSWFFAFGLTVYLSAFLPNAIYLREVFRRRRERDRTVLIVCGLLLSWVVGKGLTFLCAAVLSGGMSAVREFFIPFFYLKELLWFRWPMILLSLLGCAALGWLFGKGKKGEGGQ